LAKKKTFMLMLQTPKATPIVIMIGLLQEHDPNPNADTDDDDMRTTRKQEVI
jgi:hypothetical protein